MDHCRKCPAKIPLMRINNAVKKAIAVRLRHILEEEERGYLFWEERVKSQLKPTRAGQVERKIKQRIQALRIVIWMLTPLQDRDSDFPGYWKN